MYQEQHKLQPLIDLAFKEAIEQQKPTKKTLLILASRLVKFAPNKFNYGDFYSIEEKEKAIKLLKENGLEKYCNLSPRCKRDVLLAIAAEYTKEAA
jgi:hypothetical protein